MPRKKPMGQRKTNSDRIKTPIDAKDEMRPAKLLKGFSRSIENLNRSISEMADFLCKKDTINSILVTGQSGIGKTVLVDLVLQECRQSHGKDSIAIDCSAIEPNLIRSELFGHVKGAFTGAVKERKGLLQEADDKILFLDEIGNISTDIQKALLQAVEGRQLRPVGASDTKGLRANFGLITATNKDIRNSTDFAQDLYYRISLWPVEIPPLSKRKIDIIPLTCDILDRHKIYEPKITRSYWSPANLYALMEYDWHIGGYRQLEQEVLHLIRNGKFTAQFQRDFDNLPNEELVVMRGMAFTEFLSRNGAPESRKYLSPNHFELGYTRGCGKKYYQVTIQEDKVANIVETWHYSTLHWPEQKEIITSRGIYDYLKNHQIIIHPRKLLELLKSEAQYYDNYLPQDFEDPKTSFDADLFFMGLVCPHQSFRPGKYIPYTSFKKISDKTGDETPRRQRRVEFEFPLESLKKRSGTMGNLPDINAEQDDQKSMNQLLTKYGYSNLTDDFKKLILRGKTLNRLSWNEIEEFHGIDRRSIPQKPATQ
jgi:transcriptional regulator with AAA-type ATPase domain